MVLIGSIQNEQKSLKSLPEEDRDTYKTTMIEAMQQQSNTYSFINEDTKNFSQATCAAHVKHLTVVKEIRSPLMENFSRCPRKW